MKRFFKIRYLLLLFLGFWIWRSWPQESPVTSMAAPPEAGLQASASPEPTPRPRRRAHLVFKKAPLKRAKGKKVRPHILPGAEPILEESGDTFAAASDTSPQAASLFDNIAFSSEEEVRLTLGEPDEKYDHDDRQSWYYKAALLSRQGKSVCPEVQFIDGQARMLIMWSPDKMQELIDTAKRVKAEGQQAATGPETFTFLDSFKYLGVGTPVETVLEDLGEPDRKLQLEGKEEWDYDTLIVENGDSQSLAVIVKGDKVVEVQAR